MFSPTKLKEKKLGLSQSQLVQFENLVEPHVTFEWESGKQSLIQNNLSKLSEILNVDL